MIALVRNDQGDWIGLYINGKLVEEGHSFEASHLLALVGIAHTEILDVDLDPFGGCLPRGLNDVPHGTATLVEAS